MRGARLSRQDLSRRGRGSSRVLVLALVLVATAALATGCGEDAATEGEKAADAVLLNEALAHELTAVHAYAHGRLLLRGELGAVGREFRAQAQEHVSGITKALRGLGGETDAEAEELDYSALKTQADFLSFAYELENAALAAYVSIAPRLETYGPRALATSLAANHAQHLTILRQGLGAGLAASAPEALETGDSPSPPVPTSTGGALETPAG
jgi:rubrerythrin